MQFQTDLRRAILALSDTLDLVGIDEIQHGKRVGYMAMRCGETLGLPATDLDSLLHAGLVHDCGVSSSEVHRRLVDELDWDGADEHCRSGHRLLKDFGPLAGLAPVILYHHTHWQQLDRLELPPAIKRDANLVFLVDRVDALAAPHYGKDLLAVAADIQKRIQALSPAMFAPELVDAFLETARTEAFWLSLEPRHIEHFLRDAVLEQRPVAIDFRCLHRLATIFARIVDSKSTFTWEHSLGVARLAEAIGGWYGLTEERCQMLEIAGLLHDLGKLQVPDAVLEKPGPLDPLERSIMSRHSFETFQILRQIPGFEEIAIWAAYHHEALGGSGYPFHKHRDEIGVEARIVAIADVFQALAQRRPYRDSLPPEKIVSMLSDMAEAEKLDPELVDLVRSHLDEAWICARRAEGDGNAEVVG